MTTASFPRWYWCKLSFDHRQSYCKVYFTRCVFLCLCRVCKPKIRPFTPVHLHAWHLSNAGIAGLFFADNTNPLPSLFQADIYCTLMPERTFSISQWNCTFRSVFILSWVLLLSFYQFFCYPDGIMEMVYDSPALYVAECSWQQLAYSLSVMLIIYY